MPKFICVTCGVQFAELEKEPERCPICEDARQFVGFGGQQWTTLDEMREGHHNRIKQEEAGIYSIHTEPGFGIGQRALLVQSPSGNVLWDCVTLLDADTIATVKGLGGIQAIAISHPHYYSSMVEWSETFGGAPIYLHEADAEWIIRPSAAVRLWRGESKALQDGLTLIRLPGHFDGFQALHWKYGAAGKGALLSGDQPQVCMDTRWVSFMYSYPNLIPLPAATVRGIVERLRPYEFDRIYGAFPHRTVARDGKAALARSAERYLRAMGAMGL